MTAIRIWWLPVLMGIGQILVWPVAPYVFTEPPEPLDAAGGVVITVIIAVALGWRRRAPVPVLIVCTVAASTAAFVLPNDVLTVIGIADLVVLYSLAALRPARYALVAVVALVAVWILALVAVDEPDLEWAIALVVVVYTSVAALGANRGRWQRARAAAAARLLASAAEQRRAAEAERERLARELHDVTAHHLTAIVVNAGAARRLGATQPELVRQALEFAAETGRRTLTALNRLVTVIEPGVTEPLAPRLARLATTARSAGQQVRVTVDGAADELPATVVDAVFAVVQEAATNALRYAAGADVTATVTVSDESVRVEVHNPPGSPGSPSLGSGRGLTGLAARAKGLGGTFDAGPCPTGGWRVQSDLPCVTRGGPGRRLLSTEGALDAAIMLLVVSPALVVMVIDGGSVRAQWWLLTLLILLHAAPVWWRRTAPWRTLLAVVTAGLAFAVIVAVTRLPLAAVDPLVLGFGAEMVAAWAVASRGRPTRATWSGAVAVAVSVSVMLIIVSQDLRQLAHEGHPVQQLVVMIALTLAIFTAAITAFLLLAIWGPATILRRRRERTLDTEAAALRAADERAAAAAQDQRQRFAVGLHASVIEPAERLVAAAESVPPDASPAVGLAAVDQVTAEARAGLAAMRELLGAIQPVPVGDRSAPPRGIADLADLCSERQVPLEASPILHPLPVAVDLSGYRIVDAALDSISTGSPLSSGSSGSSGDAVSVSVDHIRETLVVTVSGVPGATRGIVAARIRARAAALGGKIRFDPAGVVQVHLPAPAEPVGSAPQGEVPASTSA